MAQTTIKMLNQVTGGLSSPSKMPGRAWSIPAKTCITGSKLRDIKGSVCSGCYAMKGRYVFLNVQAALYRRLNSLSHPDWVEAMAELIARQSPDWFRWMDSGDLQSTEMLNKIAQVCRLTQNTKHWLPTREYKIVFDWLKTNEVPENLCIRLSAHMIGGAVPTFGYDKRVTISTVSLHEIDIATVHNCPSRHQGNSCGDCRACWDKSVRQVSYIKH